MTTVNATEIKNRFGEYLDLAYEETVEITRSGRPVAVMMSVKRYKKLLNALEDLELGKRAVEANEEGYIGEKSSATLIKKLLNASN